MRVGRGEAVQGGRRRLRLLAGRGSVGFPVVVVVGISDVIVNPLKLTTRNTHLAFRFRFPKVAGDINNAVMEARKKGLYVPIEPRKSTLRSGANDSGL